MPEDSKRRAQFEANAFYERLRRLVRRYEPQKFATSFSHLLYDLIDGRQSWAYYPPHFVISAIEANCAYHQPYIKTVELTRARINEIIDHYKDYRDPYVKYALIEEEDLGLWALATAHQQFVYQRKWDSRALARAIRLFAANDPLLETDALFFDRYGLHLSEWIMMCFSVVSYTVGASAQGPLTTLSNYLDTDIARFPKDAVDPFFNASSLTFEEVGREYLELRNRYPAYLHISLPSVFLDAPFLKIDDGTYLAIHPGLVFYHCLDGLHRACQKLEGETFGFEFGRSFEAHVLDLLEKLKGVSAILLEQDLRADANDRACDFAIVMDDCLLLIECKAVRFSADLATENAIRNDNSSAKIAHAISQLSATAARVRKRSIPALQHFNITNVIGFVVTFGRVYFANSSDYLERYVLPRMANETLNTVSKPFDYRPQVISIDVLEDIFTVLNAEGINLPTLIERREQEDYAIVGDWDPYLYNRYQNTGADWLSFVSGSTIDNFMEQFGIEGMTLSLKD